MKFILLACIATATAAQSLPWVDISGDWRMSRTDDARFAAPDFDDSRWETIRLPAVLPGMAGREGGPAWLWLRREIELSPEIDRKGLTVTLGKLSENYRLFVNGVQVAQVGNFDRVHSQLARPRSFDLPLLPAGRTTIAIQVWIHAFYGSTAWRRYPDPGPYLITSRINAPRSAGGAYLDSLRALRTSDVIAGVALLTLGMILALMFLHQRSRPEVLALAFYGFATTYRRLQIPLGFTPNATPFRSDFWLGAVGYALLAEFALAWMGVRPGIWRWILWILTAAAIPSSNNVAHGTLLVVVTGTLVWLLYSGRRGGWFRWLILTATAAVFVTQVYTDSAQSLLLTRWLNPTDLYVEFGPYAGPLHPIAAAFFLLGMVLILTGRALADGAEKERMSGELEAARTVQRILLPSAGAADGPLVVQTVYQPAQEVGGDFYLTELLDGDAILALVGDVSGKGLKAAMVVSLVVGALRNRRTNGPAAILAELNHVLGGQTDGGFVTCIVARPDASGEAVIASAGHPAPYADGRELEVATGLPLGIAPGVTYDETITAGGQFTFISDGVVEAENAQRELFGFDRTREISTKSAQEIAEAAKAWGQNDDITVVTVRSRD